MTEDRTVLAAHQAIRLAKSEEMSPEDMLSHLVNGKISVPMSEAPTIQDGKIEDWKPAVMTQTDATRWLIAFTTPELAQEYCTPTSSPYYITIETRWVLRNLPPGIGILFNPKSEVEFFKWSAEGVASYRKTVLEW